jgi:phosphomannomutase
MIKFGTDGWRAVIADEFTFDNVKIVAQAFSDNFSGQNIPVVIGFDNRFLSSKFAYAVAEVLSGNGIDVFLCDKSCPTPAVSMHVVEKGAAAGIMITASHNPPRWNGFKIKEPVGCSSSVETTKKVEALLGKSAPKEADDPKIKCFNPKETYLKKVKAFADLDLISASKIKIICDTMHGSGTGYLKDALASSAEVIEINGNADPTFAGINPEPIEKNLSLLMKTCKQTGLSGVALDGDADRIAGCGADGVFINTHQIFALLLYHLVENKKMTGDVVKTFNISRLIDRMAAKYGLKLHETPIGFKYIADIMLKGDVLMGGEESGGMGIKNHLPERDGVLAGLLLAELMAVKKKSLDMILEDISKEFGYFCYDRLDLHLDEEKKNRIIELLKDTPPKELGGMAIKEIQRLDGTKLIFDDGSWILFRASGTEPLLRVYCEAPSKEAVATLLQKSRLWMNL